MLFMMNRAASSALPDPAVLEEFGVAGEPVATLPGGEGQSVQVGDLVLKPVDDVAEVTWCAEVLDRVAELGFRVARPARGSRGEFVVDNWSAARRVDGVNGNDPGTDWAGLLSAARAFHEAIRDEPRPSFLDRREHRWAVADRVAWDEAQYTPLTQVAERFHTLQSLLRPVEAVNQVIHGDLTGNVLFAAGQAPAIIDFSPYWRPASYADAIVAVDGLLWYGAGPELVRLAATGADFPQMLVRASLFRLVALDGMARIFGTSDLENELKPFDPVIAYIKDPMVGATRSPQAADATHTSNNDPRSTTRTH